MLAEAAAHGFDLLPIVVLLAAAVIAVPLFKLLGLDSVLGYLAAGFAIGPFGISLFSDAQSILYVAELGVVMFLFVIGLEMQPSRLWAIRGELFGLSLAQVGLCIALLICVGLALGYPVAPSFFCGYRVRPHFDRDRDADARRTARARVAEGAARRVDPAARGSGDRPVAGALEVDADTIVDIMADTRQRDRDRLAIEMVEAVYATRHLIRGNMPVSAAGDSKVSPKTD